jgi:transposase InsO family protein
MSWIVQFESHKNELPHIYQREHDRAVLEYYDQPPQIKFDYAGANGRRISFWHTADFFVIQKNIAGWEECKTEEDLARLAETQPERYCRDEDGVWRCPPGESYAEQFGLYYRVCSSAEINWTYQRNVEFLEDYHRADTPMVSEAARSAVLSLLASEPGITLENLFGRVGDEATRDDVQMLIASEEIYVDLHRYEIAEADKARVYPDADTAAAYAQVIETPPGERLTGHFVNMRIGELVLMDAVGWKIANVGETLVGLVGEGQSYTEIPIRAFEEMVKEGRVVGAKDDGPPRLHPEAERLFLSASREALAAANRRADLLSAWERGELEPDAQVPERTLRLWRSLSAASQVQYGNGYIGLLSKERRGNPSDKLPPATRQLINYFIENDYETHKQKGKFAVYAAYLKACEGQQVEPASYKTFCRAVKLRPAGEQTFKRQGRRAAYKYQEFYWELEYTTPRHGGHPFHICHMDHTELDVELICSITGRNLGRPWLTILVDAYSRRFLGLYLTFDPPSYRSCMMVLRDCVSRFKRLPQTVVVDGGIEFASVYLETLLASCECTKKERPPAAGRVGSLCERLLGTLHTQFVNNLRGNTQVMKNVRQVTKSVNPKGKAVWTLQTLNRFLHQYAFEVYDATEHPALGQSPRDAFATGMVQTGNRAHRLLAYDETFKMLTLPSTRRGKAKVEPGRGIKVNTIYYWSDSFRAPQVERSSVPVRYDPWDASTVYAYVGGQWVRCLSQYYKTFRGRSERELMLASAALRKRLSRGKAKFTITAKRLADFLASAEAEETVLGQRLADIEGRSVRAAIDGSSGATCTPVQPDEAAETAEAGGGVTEGETITGSSESTDPEEYEEF